MRRIAIAIGLCGLLAACGQESRPTAEGGTGAPLDFIDAVPITEDAPPPVAQPQTAAKKEEEPEEDREEPAEDEKAAEPARPTPTPDPAPADNAEAATRRANENATPPEATNAPPPTN